MIHLLLQKIHSILFILLSQIKYGTGYVSATIKIPKNVHKGLRKCSELQLIPLVKVFTAPNNLPSLNQFHHQANSFYFCLIFHLLISFQ